MNRRRFILNSLGATLALPALPSLMASAVGGNSAVQSAKGAGAGARRFVAVGNLLGTRMALNELVAYSLLGQQKAMLDPRSFTIATFALCGFANLSSIGIQIGGIGALAPNKKMELARLGLRAMLAGTMANLMSASIAGMLLT